MFYHLKPTHILRIPYAYTCQVTNVEIRATSGCRPLSHLVTDRRLRLCGHIVRSSPQEDHHRAVAAVIRRLPPDWKRPLGRPSHTWLRALEAYLGQLNIGLAFAWRKAAIREDWRRIVNTATLQRSMRYVIQLQPLAPAIHTGRAKKVSPKRILLIFQEL